MAKRRDSYDGIRGISIALALKFLRAEQNLTLRMVARHIGVSLSALGKFEIKLGGLDYNAVAKLPDLFECKGLQDMVNKATGRAILTFIGYNNGGLEELAQKTHISPEKIEAFVRDGKGLDSKEIASLPKALGLDSVHSLLRNATHAIEKDAKETKQSYKIERGLAFRRVRTNLGIKLTAAAKEIKISPAALMAYEKGRSGISKRKLLPFLHEKGFDSVADLINAAHDLPPEIDKYTVSLSYRVLRRKNEFTHKKVSSVTGLGKGNVGDFGRGNINAIGIKNLEALPRVFDCTNLSEMINKAVGAAIFYEREAILFTYQDMAVKLGVSADELKIFEETGSGISQETVSTFPEALGYDSLNELLQGVIILAPPKSGKHQENAKRDRAKKSEQPKGR